jgi:hypothetical protein
MAQDSIVGGLFGLTPEMYQRSQQAADQQEAMQFAQLSPFQQASAGFYSAGRGIGRGIGTLLGVEDPQLKMIAQQQQILRNVDPNDPESLAQGARMASEMGNARLASALSKQASDTALNRASIAQKLRERQAADPFNQLVSSGKYTPESLAAYRESGNIADLKLVEKFEKPMTFGAERESIAFELYGKRVSDLNQNEIAEVNRRAEASATGRAKAGATQVLVPGVKEVKDVPGLRKTVQDTIKPDLDVVRATQQALNQLDISIKSSSPIAFNATRVQLARAIGGGGDLAIKEIQAAGGDPSLVGRLLDTTSTLFTGTPTVELQNQIKTTLNALKTVATNRANNELQTQRDLAVAAGFKPEDIGKAFKFKELETVSPTNLTPAEQAAAELARRRAQQK